MSRRHMMGGSSMEESNHTLTNSGSSIADEKAASSDSLDVLGSGHQREQERKLEKKWADKWTC